MREVVRSKGRAPGLHPRDTGARTVATITSGMGGASKIKTREGTTRDPEFEKKHPRAGKGRVGGGQFIQGNSQGPAAQAVRKRLGATDGNFKAAVMRFQRRKGLVVDGVVGTQTAAAMLGKGKRKVGALTDEDRKGLRKMGRRVEEGHFDPNQPRDRSGRWRETRATLLSAERALRKRSRSGASRKREELLAAEREVNKPKRKSMGPTAYAMDAMAKARAAGGPLPWHLAHMVEGQMIRAWQAALDAFDNGNDELTAQHVGLAMSLEERAVFRPELHPRSRLGRFREKIIDMEKRAKLRAKGVKSASLLTGPELGLGPQLIHEAATIDFNPQRHPRDRIGRFREVLGGLQANQSVKLPGGTFVTKRVEKGRVGDYEHFEVKRPDVKRAFMAGNVEFAAQRAAEAEPELKQESASAPTGGGMVPTGSDYKGYRIERNRAGSYDVIQPDGQHASDRISHSTRRAAKEYIDRLVSGEPHPAFKRRRESEREQIMRKSPGAAAEEREFKEVQRGAAAGGPAPAKAADYLAEPIMFGGEVKTRGEVIAELQQQGHRQVLIDRFMQGSQTLTSPEGPPRPMTPAERMNEPEAELARREGGRTEVGISAADIQRAKIRDRARVASLGGSRATAAELRKGAEDIEALPDVTDEERRTAARWREGAERMAGEEAAGGALSERRPSAAKLGIGGSAANPVRNASGTWHGTPHWVVRKPMPKRLKTPAREMAAVDTVIERAQESVRDARPVSFGPVSMQTSGGIERPITRPTTDIEAPGRAPGDRLVANADFIANVQNKLKGGEWRASDSGQFLYVKDNRVEGIVMGVREKPTAGGHVPAPGAQDPTWRVYVRGEPFTVVARDIDAARTEGMQTAMRERGWKLREVFVATPTDRITRLPGGAKPESGAPSPLSSSSRERGLAQVEAERRSGRARPRIRPEDAAAAELGEPVEGHKPAAPSAGELRGQDIATLAQMIRSDWGGKVNFAAKPYLDAMRSLGSVKDRYGQDTGAEIVMRFISNAGSWRGPRAKAIKAELRRRLNESVDLRAAVAADDARANGNLELAEQYERRAGRVRPTLAPAGAA